MEVGRFRGCWTIYVMIVPPYGSDRHFCVFNSHAWGESGHCRFGISVWGLHGHHESWAVSAWLYDGCGVLIGLIGPYWGLTVIARVKLSLWGLSGLFGF